MKLHRFGADDVIFIGDETRDIEACKRAGIRCVAVTWGYNSEKSLAAQNPHRVFHRPEELRALIAGAG